MSEFFKIDSRLESLACEAVADCGTQFGEIDRVTEYNQQKVLAAFIKNRISEAHFAASTGYGYSDIGRERAEQTFADAVGAEAALFRHNFSSGTHTLAVALFGLLRPHDSMLCLTGRPYDTLIGVLGHEKQTPGSLADFLVEYEEVALDGNGLPDTNAIRAALRSKPRRVAYIQRSRGYSLRPSLSTEKIEELCGIVKEVSPDTVVVVDNCYGEFVERREPLSAGADLIAGSLIKNPGGGIAPTGGYIAGKKELVELCAARMTAPGVGAEIGATLGHTRGLLMGLFHAPHTVGEALKTAVFAACLYEKLGFSATPRFNETRADIIESIRLGSPEALTAFCRGIQAGSPVDSFVTPEAWDMPGYDDRVIMAAGAFTGGASIELSADAPIRPPYAVWMQGGLNFHSAKVSVMLATQNLLDAGLIKI